MNRSQERSKKIIQVLYTAAAFTTAKTPLKRYLFWMDHTVNKRKESFMSDTAFKPVYGARFLSHIEIGKLVPYLNRKALYRISWGAQKPAMSALGEDTKRKDKKPKSSMNCNNPWLQPAVDLVTGRQTRRIIPFCCMILMKQRASSHVFHSPARVKKSVSPVRRGLPACTIQRQAKDIPVSADCYHGEKSQ